MKFCNKRLQVLKLLTHKKSLPLLRTAGIFTSLVIFNTVNAQSVVEIDNGTSQWLAIERQINELKVDWKKQAPLLDQRLLLLNAEKKQLLKLLSNSNQSDSDVDVKRTQLLTEQTQVEQQQAQLTQFLDLLQHTNNAVKPLLPPVLKEGWSNEKNTPEQSNNSKKLQTILAELTSLADFNQRITTLESTIEIAPDNIILAQQLFLGASTAWFVTRDGQYTGWGKAGQEGWEWHVDDSIKANKIKQSIAIFQKKQTADWSTLPIHLSKKDGSHDISKEGL